MSRKYVSARNRICCPSSCRLCCQSLTAPEFVYRVKCVPLSGICHPHLPNEMLANKQCGYIFTVICAGSFERIVCVCVCVRACARAYVCGSDRDGGSNSARCMTQIFRRFRKLSKIGCYFCHVRLTICPYARNNLALIGRNFVKFRIRMFRKSVNKIRVVVILDNNNGYFVRMPVYIYDNISLNAS
jgi:hypothetical protein